MTPEELKDYRKRAYADRFTCQQLIYVDELEARLKDLQGMNEIADEIRWVYRQYYKTGDDIVEQIEHIYEELSELQDAIDDSKESSWAELDRGEYPNHTIQDELTDILILTLALCSHFTMTQSKFDIMWFIKTKLGIAKEKHFKPQSESGEEQRKETAIQGAAAQKQHADYDNMDGAKTGGEE